MKHKKPKMETQHETAPGSLERIQSSPENDGEKSLLTLIQEHRPRQSANPMETSSDASWSASTGPEDNFDEDAAYRLDNSLMRLGGNGF